MSAFWAYFTVFALALSTALVLTPLSVALGQRFDIVDRPGGRRRDHGVVARIGGIGLFGGFAVASVAAQFLPVPRLDPYEIIRFVGLMLGAAFIFAAGLLDDLFEFGPVPQFIAQIIAAAIAIIFQIFIETVNNPLNGQQTAWPFFITVTVSLFWLGLMINTVNFLDGLDGLAGGVALIAGLMLFIHSAFQLNQQSVSLLPLALVGAALGFLMYNFHPARVFMGSSGSYFLGYALGTLSIIGGAKMATILLVMGLPLLDVAWQVVNRLTQGRNPMHGDRGHLHFRLLDRGFSQRTIVLIYYGFCTMFGMLTLVTSSRFFKLVALLTMAGLVVIGFAIVARLQPIKRVADAEQEPG